MKRVFWIAAKELKCTVRDRTTLFWLTLGPMLIVALISAAYGSFAKNANLAAQSVPGFALMFVLFGISTIGESIFEERDNGTLQRMMISSVSKYELLGGKLMAGYIVGVSQMLVLFTMGYFVFKVPFGYSLEGRMAVLLVLVSGCLAALSLGLFLASLFSNRKQFSTFYTVLVLAMCQVGGAWLPLFLMPGWIRELSRFTFISHAMEAFNLTHFGRGLGAVLPNIAALLIYAAICFAFAFYLFEMRSIAGSSGRRRAFVSVAVFLVAIYAGSRVNAISYPSFIEDDKSQSQTQARAAAVEKTAEKASAADAESLFRASQESWDKKESEPALSSLESAITLEPKNSKYLDKYGEFIIGAAGHARGEKFLSALLKRSETADLQYQIGRIAGDWYRKATTAEERQRVMILSLDSLSRAIELNDKHWEARLTRGIMNFYMPPPIDRVADATADFEWLVKEKPQLAVAYRYLADCYVKANDAARARTFLNEAITRFPNDQKLKDRLSRLGGGQN